MEYILHILVICGIYSILALSLNLIIGYTGLINLGHAAFYATGAYVSALLTLQAGFSPWIGLIAGAFGAGIIGMVIALPSLRLKSDYLALATLGAGIVLYQVAKNWTSLTRGPMGLPGIPRLSAFGIAFNSTGAYLAVVSIFVAVTLLFIHRLVSGAYGRVLKSIREDEVASSVLGKNVIKYKFQVFVTGAFFAGLAGGLYAHYITFIDPSSFTVMESVTIILMVIFGGMASLSGSLAGAVILVVIPEMLRFVGMPSSVAAPLRQMIYGLLLIILMMKRPQGLFGKFRFI